MVGDAEFRKIWLWGSAVSSSMAVAFLLGLAGLDVSLVDEAIVEEKVVKAVVEEEVVEACGLERVGVDVAGVVAGSQILFVGGGAEKLRGSPFFWRLTMKKLKKIRVFLYLSTEFI